MDDLTLYFRLGLTHVLDFKAYDHMLFLAALTLPYVIKQWKNLLLMITCFTLGHTLTLSLAAYDLLSAKEAYIEFLIPFTIFCTALFNILKGVKVASDSKIALLIAFCFGWIHGLGFSYYLQMLLEGNDNKLLPLLEFSLGIEVAQALVVIGILCAYILVNAIFKVSRRDWILVGSAFILGITFILLHNRYAAFLKALL